MKKIMLIISAFCLLMISCNNIGTNNAADNQKTVGYKTYIYKDSLFIHLGDSIALSMEDDYAHYYVEMDVPQTDNIVLRQGILQWMLDAASEDYAAQIKANRDEFFTLEGGGGVPEAKFEEHVKLVEQNAKYVTYVRYGELNSAITHVNPWRVGTTFDKADGSIIGYDMFVQPEQLSGIIEKTLLSDDDYADEWGGLEHIPDFRMPSTAPWIEKDCIVFCYGSYEIGSFSYGEVECKVPVAALKPYLSEKGKALFE